MLHTFVALERAFVVSCLGSHRAGLGPARGHVRAVPGPSTLERRSRAIWCTSLDPLPFRCKWLFMLVFLMGVGVFELSRSVLSTGLLDMFEHDAK